MNALIAVHTLSLGTAAPDARDASRPTAARAVDLHRELATALGVRVQVALQGAG